MPSALHVPANVLTTWGMPLRRPCATDLSRLHCRTAWMDLHLAVELLTLHGHPVRRTVCNGKSSGIAVDEWPAKAQARVHAAEVQTAAWRQAAVRVAGHERRRSCCC